MHLYMCRRSVDKRLAAKEKCKMFVIDSQNIIKKNKVRHFKSSEKKKSNVLSTIEID